VPENAIAVGVPARVVGYRQETDEGSFPESSRTNMASLLSN
jgi:serine acetyltransferase